MKKKLFLLLAGCLLLFSVASSAQAVLKPSIGLPALPADGDSMCYAPWYLGNFDNSGLQEGDTAFDFTLYDLNGDSFNLADALNSGTPVLLVAGSYTCPVFRNSIDDINLVVNTYGSQLKVAVIYTIEAHPNIDTSVYFGYVNPTTTNIQAGILYRQPVTYGERKAVAQDLLDSMTINAPVYIDGPCNNWWSTYGPAPNNGYLISTDGIVFAHHGWFNRFPENIFCDIDSLLGTSSGLCGGGGGGSGAFSFNLLSNDTVTGPAGLTLSADGELVNNDTARDVQVLVRRLINNMPSGWASSLCLDVCYSSATDSVVFLLPAGATQPFHFYFYTSSLADTGRARVGFRNVNDSTNAFSQNLFGITTAVTTEITTPSPINKVSLYPIPASGELSLTVPENTINWIEVMDLSGRVLLAIPCSGSNSKETFSVSGLEGGFYLLNANCGKHRYSGVFSISR